MAGVLLIGSVPALDRFCNILSRDGSTFMSPLSETVSWAVLSAGFGGGGPVLLARCSEEPLTLAAAFSSALLVVEGTPSLELDAQTKDLLTQAFSCGIKAVGVTVLEPLDGFLAPRGFEEFSAAVTKACKHIGFKADRTLIQKLSPDAAASVASEPLRALAAFNAPAPPSKTSRVVIHSVESVSGSEVTATAMLLCGNLRAGDTLTGRPSGINAQFTSISSPSGSLSTPQAPSLIKVTLSVYGDPESVQPGTVFGPGKDFSGELSAVAAFQAQVIVVESSKPMEVRPGDMLYVIVSGKAHLCQLTFIPSALDKRTGLVQEVNPTSLKSGDAGIVVLNPTQPMYCDTFADVPALGRFSATTAEARSLLLVGIIKSIEVCSLEMASPKHSPGEAAAAAGGSGARPVLTRAVSDLTMTGGVPVVTRVIAQLTACETEVALTAALDRLLAARAGERPGTAGLCVSTFPEIRANISILASAIEEHKAKVGPAWTPEVAKKFGDFLQETVPDPLSALCAGIRGAMTTEDLCSLLESVTSAATRVLPGPCGVCASTLNVLREGKPSIMSVSIAKRDSDGAVWTPDVAKQFGAFLRVIS